MTVENIGEITEYLTTNAEVPEVKTYLESFRVQPTLEIFKSKLNDPDFKSFLDSSNDVHSSKSLKTWQDNNLDKIYQERFLRENPTADPRDVELTNMKNMIEQMKAEGNHKELTIKTSKLIQEKHLPMELLEILQGSDEATTIANLTALETVFSAHVEAMVAERLKGGYTPPAGTKSTGAVTKEMFAKMGYSERAKLATEQPAIYKELAK